MSTTQQRHQQTMPATHAELAILKPSPAHIKQARELAGHTQQQAAEAVHVDGRAWRRWELGERQISGAAWELYLIKILGFTPIK